MFPCCRNNICTSEKYSRYRQASCPRAVMQFGAPKLGIDLPSSISPKGYASARHRNRRKPGQNNRKPRPRSGMWQEVPQHSEWPILVAKAASKGCHLQLLPVDQEAPLSLAKAGGSRGLGHAGPVWICLHEAALVTERRTSRQKTSPLQGHCSSRRGEAACEVLGPLCPWLLTGTCPSPR